MYTGHKINCTLSRSLWCLSTTMRRAQMRNEPEIFFLLETITGKYLSTFISIYQPLYLSIYLSIYHIYISIYRSIYLSIYPSIHLSIYLSIYLSIVYLSYLSFQPRVFYPTYVSIDQSTYFLLNQLPSYIPTFLSDVTAYLLTYLPY